MFIERIELQNVKSYGSTPTIIEFGAGVNLIAGMNGAGKSTILEAIGFALFDALPYNQKEFVRRGKSGSSRILVRIRSSYDDRLYDIERTINPSNYAIFDVEENFRESLESKTEALEWIRQHLKVEQTTDLEALFNNAVGMQQGTITSVFFSTPRIRKDTFDALLRVQDYEDAWTNLRETNRHIENLIQKNSEEIARKEGQTERLPELEATAEQIREKIGTTEQQHSEAVKHIKVLTETLEQLQQQKTALDELERKIEQAEAKIENLETQVESAQQNYEQSASAKQIVIESEEASNLYGNAVERLRALEGDRRTRDALVAEQNEIKERRNASAQRLEQLKSNLDTAERAKQELQELEPLVQQQEQLESKHQQALEVQKMRDRLQEQVDTDKRKLEELAIELGTLREAVEKRQALNTEVSLHSQEREQLSTQIDELSTKRSELKENLQVAEHTFEVADTDFKQYETLNNQLTQKQSALDDKENEKNAILADLEQRKTLDAELEDLNQKLIQETSEQQSARDTIQRVADAIEELQQLREMVAEDGAICPVCRREMQGKVHEDAINYYAAQENALNEERQQAQATIDDTEEAIITLTTDICSAESVRDQLANKVALSNVEEEIVTLQSDVEELNTHLQELIDAPHVKVAAEAKRQQEQDILNQHDDTMNDLSSQRERLTETIADLRGEVSELVSQDEFERRENEYQSLLQSIEANQKTLNQYDTIDADTERIANELADLDNPRRRQAIAQNEAIKRADFEREQQEQQILFEAAEADFADIGVELQSYTTLDADITECQTLHDTHAEGHQLYAENKQLAELFDARKQQLAVTQNALQEVVSQQEESVQEYDNLKQVSDSEQYDAFEEEKISLETERTELAKDIEYQQEQLLSTTDEIDKLQQIIAQLQELEITQSQLLENQIYFAFVRDGIRDAGPRIRERKVRLVSEHASRYFNEIISDYAMRLEWDANDYGINIEQNGEIRPFQVLSGGEQMIAALSVRLALLTHMTRIRLIFLDEPTINLDDNRRVMLAEQLSKIRDLQQLFVISHDDTFVEGSNHVIRIEKDGNLSKVN